MIGRLIEVPKYIGWPAVILTAYGSLWYFASRSVYYPLQYPQGHWALGPSEGAEDAWIQTSDGLRLHGWWLPRPGALVTTLHLHGNAGNVTHRIAHAREIMAAGSSILLLDYRGYGRSEGRPTERGLYRDADAAYDYLLAKGVAPGKLIIHGESLGSAAAVDLAARRSCAGVVLEAPFTSVQDVAARVVPYAGRWLIWGFNSRSKIARLRVPLLVMHGDRDEVIDYALGQALFEAAPQPKIFWSIPDAGHNDILDAAGPEYRKRLEQFYRSLTGSGPDA